MSDRPSTGTALAGRGEVLYEPSAATITGSRIAEFRDAVAERTGLALDDYPALWSWSVEHLDDFWTEMVRHFDLEIHDLDVVLADRAVPRATWMPGATLSYAAHALRHTGDGPALVGISQTRDDVTLSWDGLRDAVARCRTGLAALGVVPGDRVVGYIPNIPEAVVAFLATASLGAVWASCPPEFGPTAVTDRLAQIEPKVLITVEGYVYGEKVVDRAEAVTAIREGLPSLEHVVVVDYSKSGRSREGTTSWADLLAKPGELVFEPVAFDHPLYVLFSSGTSGLPKAIVHGHGGILLEHVKALGLHNDVRKGDRFFWQSTTGWMVWNYAVSALVLGATMVCSDGNPAYPDSLALWRLVADHEVTYFGTSAGHLMAGADAGLRPATDLDLSRLRGVGSTGSPLSADGFRWVYSAIGNGVLLTSVSGGTDICSAFVGGSVMSTVRAGEISAPTLGAHVVALDEAGHELIDDFGELSVLAPMPSMPVTLWNDIDGSRLTKTYFARHEGVWSHGDWVTFHDDLSCVITGRSDATLNRGGVRLGTSDFYTVVEQLPDVDDSVVVHLEDGGNGELVLLVATPTTTDSGALEQILRRTIREELSPRHVPDRVVLVEHLPRTLTGKRLEQPIKNILLGRDPAEVVSRDSVTRPEALDAIQALARPVEQSRRTDAQHGGTS